MATTVGVGSSRQADSFGAGREAAQKAVDSVGSQPDVLLVFASTCYEQETLLKGIVSVSPSALLVGCSSAGEILSSGPSRRSIAIMAIKSDSMRAASGLGISLTKNPRQAGREAATQS